MDEGSSRARRVVRRAGEMALVHQARHDRVRRRGGQTRAGRGHDEAPDQRVAERLRDERRLVRRREDDF